MYPSRGIARDSHAVRDTCLYAEWAALSVANTTVTRPHKDAEISRSGLSAGVRATSWQNPASNPAYSYIFRRKYRWIYSEDPFTYEFDKGDDQFGATRGYLAYMRVNRLARWCGFRGAESKCIGGPRWSEYADERGILMADAWHRRPGVAGVSCTTPGNLSVRPLATELLSICHIWQSLRLLATNHALATRHPSCHLAGTPAKGEPQAARHHQERCDPLPPASGTERTWRSKPRQGLVILAVAERMCLRPFIHQAPLSNKALVFVRACGVCRGAKRVHCGL